MRAKEFITESKTVEFEGLTLKISKNGHQLMVNALDDWGNKVLGHVTFNIGDGKELDPQDLKVDDKYQGQGIARVMYDYVKSLGYTIVRSYDQTDAGKGFWDKHRGEEVRVWEESNSTNVISAEKLWDYVSKIHPKDQQGVAEGSQEINWVKPNFDFEWHEVEEQSRMKQVPVDVRQYYQKHFPNKDAWLKAVQNGKAVVVPPDHAYEIRNAPFDKESLQKVLAPTGHEGPIGPAKEKRVNDLFDKGQVEMPIILKTSQGLWLIGGKTRLGTANYVKGLPAKVWLISGEQGVSEAANTSGAGAGMMASYQARENQPVIDYMEESRS